MSSNPDPRDLGVDPAVARHAVLHGFTRREAIARDTMLGDLQRESFGYFVHEVNEANGLVLDKTAPDWPASVAAIGMRGPVQASLHEELDFDPSDRKSVV